MDTLLAETAQRLFADHADNTDGEALWTALEDSDLTRAWVPESLGGFALSADDGFGLIGQASASTAAVPFAETLLASWLLSSAGLQTPTGKLAVAISDSNSNSNNTIAFAAEAEHLACLDAASGQILLYPTQQRAVAARDAPTLGEDPQVQIDFTASQASAQAACPNWLSAEQALAFAALVRAVQIAAAAEAALQLSIEYSAQREQFGRPLSKFQAIQHLLSETAGEAAAAAAACDAAVAAVDISGGLDLAAAAVAKLRASEAAGIVAAHAHQIHGAIGYTQEYSLARLSRRLWQWRDDYGDETVWAAWLGRRVLQNDAPLWAQITGGIT